jgi:hypothetical protein
VLSAVGGSVEGGIELRDRRAREVGLAVVAHLRDRLPATSAGLLYSISRILTMNSKPCARVSLRRNRKPTAGQRRKNGTN